MSSNDNEQMADMAGELMHAKMEAASASTSMTHLLQLGSFRMEIVPNKDIDVEKIFRETIADLYDKFGEEVLKINTADIIKASQMQHGSMHG